ncbi:hypothetical protein [Thermogymnomonas acidicola]|uniref:hypothetical protein n=1 Tax=Thermogymnomonas acidicola TaxID=399579 RepID=UPI0009461FA6|nr:hypothetical protein [Thermogymnomonas acidicola]
MGDQAIIDRAMGKIADGMNVVERLSQEIGEEGTSLKPEIVGGIYAGVLLQFFTRDARDTLVEESVSASDSRFGTGVRRSLAAVAKINEMRKKAEVEECEELSCFCSWFSDYMDTFRYFIGDREEINFMMGDSRDGASEQYRYDALWLMQNADYLKTEHGIVVTGLKDKPDRGFDVRITGLPYTDVSTREVSMTFQEIYGKERREMLDSLERAFRFLNACGGLPTQAKDLVKAIVNVTGYPERLSYRVQLGS